LPLDPDGMILIVAIERGDVHFVPVLGDDRGIHWVCESGEGFEPSHMPSTCAQ
jgi:hypothetical protein